MIEQSEDDTTFFGGRITSGERAGLFVVAMVLAAFACWIFWITESFVDGKGWGDVAIRLAVHDLAFSISLFSVGLTIFAVFAPRWLNNILEAAARKLHSTIALVFVIFALTCAFFLLV